MQQTAAKLVLASILLVACLTDNNTCSQSQYIRSITLVLSSHTLSTRNVRSSSYIQPLPFLPLTAATNSGTSHCRPLSSVTCLSSPHIGFPSRLAIQQQPLRVVRSPPLTMLIPRKNRLAILTYLFKGQRSKAVRITSLLRLSCCNVYPSSSTTLLVRTRAVVVVVLLAFSRVGSAESLFRLTVAMLASRSR